MKTSISHKEAKELLDKHISKKELKLHSRESEVIMQALAKRLGEDEEFWGICGLLHDLDLEEVEETAIEKHGTRTVEILKEEGYDIPEMFHAIMAHVEGMNLESKEERTSKLDYALAAAENISGFIVAVSLMRPTKLEGMKPKSVVKKLKQKSFASNVNRDFINDIEKVGLERAEFLEIAIGAIREVEDEIFNN